MSAKTSGPITGAEWRNETKPKKKRNRQTNDNETARQTRRKRRRRVILRRGAASRTSAAVFVVRLFLLLLLLFFRPSPLETIVWAKVCLCVHSSLDLWRTLASCGWDWAWAWPSWRGSAFAWRRVASDQVTPVFDSQSTANGSIWIGPRFNGWGTTAKEEMPSAQTLASKPEAWPLNPAPSDWSSLGW